MSKKKLGKVAGKAKSSPPPSIQESESAPAVPSNQSIESDTPPAARRSTEADNEGGDVERLDNTGGSA